MSDTKKICMLPRHGIENCPVHIYRPVHIYPVHNRRPIDWQEKTTAGVYASDGTGTSREPLSEITSSV